MDLEAKVREWQTLTHCIRKCKVTNQKRQQALEGQETERQKIDTNWPYDGENSLGLDIVKSLQTHLSKVRVTGKFLNTLESNVTSYIDDVRTAIDQGTTSKTCPNEHKNLSPAVTALEVIQILLETEVTKQNGLHEMAKMAINRVEKEDAECSESLDRQQNILENLRRTEKEQLVNVFYGLYEEQRIMETIYSSSGWILPDPESTLLSNIEQTRQNIPSLEASPNIEEPFKRCVQDLTTLVARYKEVATERIRQELNMLHCELIAVETKAHYQAEILEKALSTGIVGIMKFADQFYETKEELRNIHERQRRCSSLNSQTVRVLSAPELCQMLNQIRLEHDQINNWKVNQGVRERVKLPETEKLVNLTAQFEQEQNLMENDTSDGEAEPTNYNFFELLKTYLAERDQVIQLHSRIQKIADSFPETIRQSNDIATMIELLYNTCEQTSNEAQATGQYADSILREFGIWQPHLEQQPVNMRFQTIKEYMEVTINSLASAVEGKLNNLANKQTQNSFDDAQSQLPPGVQAAIQSLTQRLDDRVGDEITDIIMDITERGEKLLDHTYSSGVSLGRIEALSLQRDILADISNPLKRKLSNNNSKCVSEQQRKLDAVLVPADMGSDKCIKDRKSVV